MLPGWKTEMPQFDIMRLRGVTLQLNHGLRATGCELAVTFRGPLTEGDAKRGCHRCHFETTFFEACTNTLQFSDSFCRLRGVREPRQPSPEELWSRWICEIFRELFPLRGPSFFPHPPDKRLHLLSLYDFMYIFGSWSQLDMCLFFGLISCNLSFLTSRQTRCHCTPPQAISGLWERVVKPNCTCDHNALEEKKKTGHAFFFFAPLIYESFIHFWFFEWNVFPFWSFCVQRFLFRIPASSKFRKHVCVMADDTHAALCQKKKTKI